MSLGAFAPKSRNRRDELNLIRWRMGRALPTHQSFNEKWILIVKLPLTINSP
jgi:hypothetical protein